MADYPATKTLFDKAGDPQRGTTRSSLSTQIVVYVNDEPVGAIQSFQETQTRTNKKIQEVGTDGIIEIVPQSAASVTLTVNRIVFDGLSLPEAFSRGFKNIHSQRMPFDIKVIDSFAGGSDEEKTVTTYHNCWFSQLGKSYTTQDYTITENANIDCEFVSCLRGGGQSVAETQGVGGSREIPWQKDNQNADGVGIEQVVDTGGRRGGMDFPGLINAAYK
tara:strand:+ start:1189 stop:1845 length:657 start_codon:yes stop_codon:yes gene_type:complete